VGYHEPMNDKVKSLMKEWFAEEELNSNYWPYQFDLKDWRNINVVEQFCYQSFKSRNWRNRGRYFGFKRKQDYEWFLLRWS
jgi:hypothetical protein